MSITRLTSEAQTNVPLYQDQTVDSTSTPRYLQSQGKIFMLITIARSLQHTRIRGINGIYNKYGLSASMATSTE